MDNCLENYFDRLDRSSVKARWNRDGESHREALTNMTAERSLAGSWASGDF